LIPTATASTLARRVTGITVSVNGRALYTLTRSIGIVTSVTGSTFTIGSTRVTSSAVGKGVTGTTATTAGYVITGSAGSTGRIIGTSRTVGVNIRTTFTLSIFSIIASNTGITIRTGSTTGAAVGNGITGNTLTRSIGIVTSVTGSTFTIRSTRVTSGTVVNVSAGSAVTGAINKLTTLAGKTITIGSVTGDTAIRGTGRAGRAVKVVT
jgi:hypothetical protein